MNAAEILFEAYDLLPAPEEREFLELMLDRVNPGLLTKLIYEGLSLDDQQILGAALMCCDVKEWQELEAIRDVREQRKREARLKEESANRRKENIERWKKTVEKSPYAWQVRDAKDALRSEGIEI